MTKPKKPNYQKIVDKLALGLAFIALFLTSAYGIRAMLESIKEPVAYAITVGFTLALAYIVFRNK